MDPWERIDMIGVVLESKKNKRSDPSETSETRTLRPPLVCVFIYFCFILFSFLGPLFPLLSSGRTDGRGMGYPEGHPS